MKTKSSNQLLKSIAIVASVALLQLGATVPANGSSKTDKVSVEGVEFSHPTKIRVPASPKQEKQFEARVTVKNKSKYNFYRVFVEAYAPSGEVELMGGKTMKLSLLKGKSAKLTMRLYSLFYTNFDGPQIYSYDFCTIKNVFDEKICVRKSIQLFSK